MADVPNNEQDWNRRVQAENYRCVACGERITFKDREIFLERRLCSYCAQMIPKKEY
jgi:RNA polymerase-binding transcription factor DksA